MARFRILVAGVFVVIAVSPAAAGSGFLLRSQSATTLGSAQAGMTAGAEDLTTIILNPATLAYGSGTEAALNATGISTGSVFNVRDVTNVVGTPIPGTGSGNSGTDVLIPNLYAGTSITDDLRLGLAVTSLYGLGAYWSPDWSGRYYARNSQLVTQDIVPTLSYRIGPALSFGIAVDIEHAKAKATSAIDVGTVDQVLLGGALGGVAGRSDAAIRTSASSWSTGYLLGVLWEPLNGTRLGISYRSPIHQETAGDAIFTKTNAVVQSFSAVTGSLVPTGLKSQLRLPAYVAIGIRHELNDFWTVMADLQWLGWRTLRSLDARFANPAQPASNTTLNWRNSLFGTVGAKYRFNPAWAVRFGTAYDQTPTKKDFRTPAIPDSDSLWTSIGVEYRASEWLKLDAAYGHIFVANGSSELSAFTTGNTFRGNLSGTIKQGAVDYLAVQANYRF